MKYLIDECLSPDLATLAREHGHTGSMHISWLGLAWLGLAGRPDWIIARRAVDDGYILVTHNTVDFRPLYGRENFHAGIVGFNTAAKTMNLVLQKRLFLLAMADLAGEEPCNTALEISVDANRRITVERYSLPR